MVGISVLTALYELVQMRIRLSGQTCVVALAYLFPVT